MRIHVFKTTICNIAKRKSLSMWMCQGMLSKCRTKKKNILSASQMSKNCICKISGMYKGINLKLSLKFEMDFKLKTQCTPCVQKDLAVMLQEQLRVLISNFKGMLRGCWRRCMYPYGQKSACEIYQERLRIFCSELQSMLMRVGGAELTQKILCISML